MISEIFRMNCFVKVLYSVKFSYGTNYHIFRMNALYAKIKTCESLNITS